MPFDRGECSSFLLPWQEFMPPEPFHLSLRGLTGGSVYWQAQVTPSVVFDVKVLSPDRTGTRKLISLCPRAAAYLRRDCPPQTNLLWYSPLPYRKQPKQTWWKSDLFSVSALDSRTERGREVYKRKICLCLDTKFHCKTIRIPKLHTTLCPLGNSRTLATQVGNLSAWGKSANVRLASESLWSISQWYSSERFEQWS